ncbi:LytR family transcriptional regulator [Amycolatopsis acidicola]|uniref:LytR family transcriptional regulator n=1 Tax=Amycolatopsis acidicola TaxID=2596893 RepID=A0A5N0VB65_9PSEU|nr:LytR C-terminal domain-containing protein [Amycolatopsis acidicola]KAA9161842.1 LytR family transcriptional regulator [Amycolatopsis acidicola]
MNFLQSLSRPMRLAGVALIGIAVIAGVIGVVTAVSGGGSEQTAAPSPSSSASSGTPGGGSPTESPSAPSPTTTTPASGAPSTTGAPPPASPGPQQGGAPTTGPDGGVPADQAAAKWVPVRVYNNSTVKGLAARASDDFRADGWNVAETANYPYGVIPTTTAYYTPGTDEETAARALAADFGMKVEPRFEGIQNSSAGVIVIVTNDYRGLQSKGS